MSGRPSTRSLPFEYSNLPRILPLEEGIKRCYIYFVPSKNAIKTYVDTGIYHVYNRSINGEAILLCEKDFLIFVQLLSRYLEEGLIGTRGCKNYSKRIKLLAFNIIDNHFHLLLQQRDTMAMAEFMQSLQISVTSILNRKYKRIGPVFQGVYKARLIEDERDLINVSRYIHLNPEGEFSKETRQYPYSSVRCYVGNPRFTWDFVDTSTILSLFNGVPRLYLEFLVG